LVGVASSPVRRLERSVAILLVHVEGAERRRVLGEEGMEEQVAFRQPSRWDELVGDGGEPRFGEALEGLSRASGMLSASKCEMLVRSDEDPEEQAGEASDGEEYRVQRPPLAPQRGR
jgi:hypothetical protein